MTPSRQTAWVVPLDGQLDLLLRWLEPILTRPGLIPVAAPHIVLGEAGAETVELEPFDALVGPVRMAPEGVVADVIPVEPFRALRERLGATGDYAPQVVFARSDGTHAYQPIEAVASEAVYVDTLTLVELS
jgi:hypothetical protein